MTSRCRVAALALCLLAGVALPGIAQEEIEDVFGGFGSAEREEVAEAMREGEGAVVGRVFDGETGAPIGNATVILVWPDPGDGSEPKQDMRVTAGDGSYEFPSVPPGRYTLSFVKAGYRASDMTGFAVAAGQENRADFPMPPSAAAASGEVLELDAFVVEASTVDEIMAALELRMESDQLLDVMSAEDLSKYAASDVADALKRVAGVNIVEGQFAIIRGLEDRYSSTTYNGAPVPSPDPDRQSIQLDLFPSEVVSNLVIAKTFGPELPSNSSGGSIDILTRGYPEGRFDLQVAAKGGLNDNAWNEFLEFRSGSPVGEPTDGFDTLEQEYGGAVGGRLPLLGRELRYKAVVNWGTGYGTEEGFRETRQPTRFELSQLAPAGDLAFGQLDLTGGRFETTTSKHDEQLTLFGGLGLDLDAEGDHKLDFSSFWTRKDEREVELRENGYLPGFDYAGVIQQLEDDPFGGIDASSFFANGSPGQNAAFDAWIVSGIGAREFTLPPLQDSPTRGAAWWSSFLQSNSFDTRRELTVYQLNGDHDVGALFEGLRFSWATNYATTSQDEEALGARMRFEPCGISDEASFRCPAGVTPIQSPAEIPTRFPITVAALGPGKYMVNRGIFASFNEIEEKQYFGRLDGEYRTELFEWLSGELKGGYWYEEATREVGSQFLRPNDVAVGIGCNASPVCTGSGSQFVIFGDTREALGRSLFGTDLLRDSSGELAALSSTQSEASREIQALSLGGKATFWEQLDLLGGVRIEQIQIESKNDPFQMRNEFDGTPAIFPSKYLLFDRLDNTVGRREPFRAPPYNDQILGIQVPSGPCRDAAGNPLPGGGQCVDLIDRAEIQQLLNGEIDERRALPSVGLTYRPTGWLTLRGAWSQTVARPSFREIGYYVSTEPGTDDLSVGNPQLQLSDVESWDARAELVWGDVGDLFAVSLFHKTIEDPIEQIIVRDAAVFDTSSLSLYRTFFNNPSEATLQGIELEARKNLGFLSFDFLDADLGPLGFLRHLSVGGNFTYIDAEVDRSEFELARARRFFGMPTGPVPFPSLEKSRRLYSQPEWIVNADVSFDQPDWGTRITLAWFAISDVLDAAGGATEFDTSPQVSTLAYTLDRYVDEFHQLDLVASQELWKGVAVKFVAKNLTDSKRAIVYDPEQTAGRIVEREYRVGRDYSLELSWTFSGPAF